MVDSEIIKTILDFVPEGALVGRVVVIGLVVIAILILVRRKPARLDRMIIAVCVVTAAWFYIQNDQPGGGADDRPTLSRIELMPVASIHDGKQQLRFQLKIRDAERLWNYDIRYCLDMKAGGDVCRLVKPLQAGENRISIFRDRLVRAGSIRLEVLAKKNARLLSQVLLMPMELWRDRLAESS